MEIKISYDPVTFHAEIRDNENILSTNCAESIIELERNRIRITEWIESLILTINSVVNNEKYIIEIDACLPYENGFIQEVAAQFTNVRVNVQLLENGEEERRYQAIDDFFNFLAKSKNHLIKGEYAKLQNHIIDIKRGKIEVPVVATMSSGKSTLLNSLLGIELLPAANQATTATTCHINLKSNAHTFTAKVISKGEIIKESEDTKRIIEEYNQRANKEDDIKIIVEGPNNVIDVQGLNFSFIDTPGPDHIGNEKHKESTYNYLKDATDLPLVLFALDATKLNTEDEQRVLEEIAKVFADNRANKDRIIFVLNKIDSFDPEKESISGCIKNCCDYLAKFGIKNPKIFPVSAFFGLLLHLENSDLTRSQRSELRNLKEKFTPSQDGTYKAYELLDNSPLLPSQKKDILKESEKDENRTFLMYAGLSALQFYIEDYIRNHHRAYFYNKLEETLQRVYASIIDKIRLNKQVLATNYDDKRKLFQARMKNDLDSIDEHLKKVVNKLKKTSFDIDFFNNEVWNIDKEFNDLMVNARKHTITRSAAEGLIAKIEEKIRNISMSMTTTLEQKIKSNEEKYLTALKKVVANELSDDWHSSIQSSFISDFKLSVHTLKLGKTQLRISDDEFIICKEKRVRSSFFLKRWLGWRDSITKEYFDMEAFFEDKIDPLSQEFMMSIKGYKNEYTDYMDGIRDKFVEKTQQIYKNNKNEMQLQYQTSVEDTEKKRQKAEYNYTQVEIKLNELKMNSQLLKTGKDEKVYG